MSLRDSIRETIILAEEVLSEAEEHAPGHAGGEVYRHIEDAIEALEEAQRATGANG
jgi:hypothetical protein